MSHVAAVDIMVTDLAALEVVANKMGFELIRGQKTWTWYGMDVGDSDLAKGHNRKNFGKGEHALRLKDHKAGDYEIGLVPRLDGKPGWELLYDAWGGHGRRLEERAGSRLGNLKNELAVEVTTRVMARSGYKVTRSLDKDGTIVLRGRSAD